MTTLNDRAEQAEQLPELNWVRQSLFKKIAQGYSVEVIKKLDDCFVYICKFSDNVIAEFAATNNRASKETARDNANQTCEIQLSLIPMRHAAYVSAGGVRLAAVGLSPRNDIITTFNREQFQSIIDDPDILLALHKSRVLPNPLHNGATTARDLASDRVESLPNISDTLHQESSSTLDLQHDSSMNRVNHG